MGHDKIGAKEAQQRELGKNKRERLNQLQGRKPSSSEPDETKFLRYAELTVTTAKALAEFQSPKFKAIQIMTPPANPLPPAKDGNVLTIDDPIAIARVYQRMVKQVR